MKTASGHLQATQAATSPAVRRLFRLLEVLSVRDLRFVFDGIVALEPEPGQPHTGASDAAAHGEQWDFCRASLATAAARLGMAPSKRRYNDWRNEQTDPSAYAAPSTILRVLGAGKWETAVGTLGGPALDITARRLISGGKRFSTEECSAASRLFAAAVPPEARTRHAYGEWALEHVRQGDGPRVPLHAQTLVRHLRRTWSELGDDLATVQWAESKGSWDD